MIAGLTPPFCCRSNQLAEELHDARDPANPLTFLSYILPGAKPFFRHNTVLEYWLLGAFDPIKASLCSDQSGFGRDSWNRRTGKCGKDGLELMDMDILQQ